MPLTRWTPLWTRTASVRERLETLRVAALDALAVVLPVTCASCGDIDRALCRRCAEQLARSALVRECRLRVSAADGRRIPVFAASDYEGPTKLLIAALKERGRADAARPLALLLRMAVMALAESTEVRVSVTGAAPSWVPIIAPSAAKTLRARGYAHLSMLWHAAVPGASAVRGLRIIRPVRDQAGLSVTARAENLHEAYVAERGLGGERVVLVDDIVTSGATLRESVRALEAVGAVVVGCVVIAEAARRAPERPDAELDTRGG